MTFCSVEQAPIAIAAITKNTICLTITISIFNFELNELTQSTYKYRLLLLTIVQRNYCIDKTFDGIKVALRNYLIVMDSWHEIISVEQMNIDPLPLKNFLDRYAHQRRLLTFIY